MKIQGWMFLAVGVFFAAVDVVYWFWSRGAGRHHRAGDLGRPRVHDRLLPAVHRAPHRRPARGQQGGRDQRRRRRGRLLQPAQLVAAVRRASRRRSPSSASSSAGGCSSSASFAVVMRHDRLRLRVLPGALLALTGPHSRSRILLTGRPDAPGHLDGSPRRARLHGRRAPMVSSAGYSTCGPGNTLTRIDPADGVIDVAGTRRGATDLRYGAGALVLVLAAGCAARHQRSGRPARGRASAVSVSPLDGATQVPPGAADHGRRRARHAQGASRCARGKAGPSRGVLSADRTRWRSLRSMPPGVTYRSPSVAVDAPAARQQPDQHLLHGQGDPDASPSTRPLPNKDDHRPHGRRGHADHDHIRPADHRPGRRSSATCWSRPPSRSQGAWHWFDDRTVHFRPKEYWPARTKVRAGGPARRRARRPGHVRQAGLRPRLQDRPVPDHQGTQRPTTMTVERDGKVIRDDPDQRRPGRRWKYHTTNGIHLAMSREDVTIMTSPGRRPRRRRATTGSPSTTPCASPTAASTSTARPGRWGRRATPTSATAASTSARRTPSGSRTTR